MTFVVQIPSYLHPFNRFGFDVHGNFDWDIVILKFKVSNRCELFYPVLLLLFFLHYLKVAVVVLLLDVEMMMLIILLILFVAAVLVVVMVVDLVAVVI